MNNNNDDVIEQFGRLLERLQQAGGEKTLGSHYTFIYVAPGAQHVENQINIRKPLPKPEAFPEPPCIGREKNVTEGYLGPASVHHDHQRSGELEERIRQCVALLMAERYGDEPLFNQQSHWQAVYRILVDKGYCRDSDFDGFDIFIRQVMPDCVNKPYKKSSVKSISQTDFALPFDRWHYDPLTSTTRKPYDRMVAIATRFKQILEENGL